MTPRIKQDWWTRNDGAVPGICLATGVAGGLGGVPCAITILAAGAVLVFYHYR